MNRLTVIFGLLFLALIVALSSVFIVDEREKALVLQFGQVKAVKEDPGLAFKLPFIQDVVKYDDRIQSLDTSPLEVTPLDDRRLVVDAFARWRIADVLVFRQAVGAGGIATAESQLSRILTDQLREVLGTVSSQAVLSPDRAALMTRIRDAAIIEARDIGIEVVDVRIKSADLPEQNLEATFQRMSAERQREAADERARGQEAAQTTRAQADRTAVEIVSEARRDAEIIRGEAEAEKNRILSEAFSADPEFFAFYRSLRAYEASLAGGNSSMVMTPDSDFFNYLKSDTGRDGQSGGAAAPSTGAAGAAGEAPAVAGQ